MSPELCKRSSRAVLVFVVVQNGRFESFSSMFHSSSVSIDYTENGQVSLALLRPNPGLDFIDHVVSNQEDKQMEPVVRPGFFVPFA